MADRDRLVKKVMVFDAAIITNAESTPACPTTYPRRKNMITPRIVNVQGVNTPANVPNFALAV